MLELRQDLEACRAEAKESAEHANMANFQNQLLLDMVSLIEQTRSLTLTKYFTIRKLHTRLLGTIQRGIYCCRVGYFMEQEKS